MSYVDELISRGFEGYRGWGENEAREDFRATGGRGKEGGGGDGGALSSAEDYVNKLVETLTQKVVPPAIEFDTEASRRAMEEEWNPYFDQLLSDYLSEVSIGRGREGEDLATYLSDLDISRRRSKEDLEARLGILGGRREKYMGDIERESPLVQEAIGGRFADRGLYLGGEREETQRLRLEKEERAKQDYEREHRYETERAQTGATRTSEELQRREEARRLQGERYLADLERKRKQRERTLAQERERAIVGGVETLREEKFRGW